MKLAAINLQKESKIVTSNSFQIYAKAAVKQILLDLKRKKWGKNYFEIQNDHVNLDRHGPNTVT